MIEIKNVSKSYNGKKKALDNVSFKVNDGEIFAFIGHNGAGKTTLINSMIGILDFDEGDILIDNKSIKTNIIQGYNDYNKEITYTQNNKLYWQNQNDGSYIYSVEIEPGKYSIDNLIKEIEDKVYNTPKYYYSDIQLFNNHNVIKITYELDKDLVTFRSFNEYDCNFIRCDKEGNEDNNGEYMKFDLEYHNSTILLDNQYC